jgi:uncharacterized protein
MEEIYKTPPSTSGWPIGLVLLLVIIGAGAGTLMGGALGVGLASMIYTGDRDLLSAMSNPTGEGVVIPALVVQGMSSLMGFLIVPYFVWQALRKKGVASFQSNPLQLGALILAVGIVISFSVADSAIIEWNQNLRFPDFLKSFEQWARAQEDHLAELTKAITNFHSVGEFVVAFVVVAILAGVCEEFLFRGIIQTELFRGTQNIHLAIWVSAFLFSVIHVQFFGFVPRMLLGALFGYLYYWSGNILVPMLAHIVNNGFAIVMIYLYQLKVVKTDLESPDSAPWPAVITCAIITVALLFFFKKKFHSPNTIS